MKRIIFQVVFFVALVAAFVSCKTTKATLPPTSESTTKIIETVVHDTVFTTEKDSSFYKAYIDCVNGKPLLKQAKAQRGKHLATPKAALNGNELQVDCYAEAQKLFYQWKEKHEKETTTKQIPYPVVQPLTYWQKTQIYLGRVFMALLLLIIVLKMKKIIKKKT